MFPACKVTSVMSKENSSEGEERSSSCDSGSLDKISDSVVTLDESVSPKSSPSVRPARPDEYVESHQGVRETRRLSEGPAVTAQSLAVSEMICSLVRSTSGYWYTLAMWAATLVVTLALLSSTAPGFSKPFCLAVDNGAGAVLFQLGADEIQLPVCYFSKKFNDQQRRYATTENATLALILAVHHFEAYLGALQKVGLSSDHDRLACLLMRSFNFGMFWQPLNFGTGNVLADALSRIP